MTTSSKHLGASGAPPADSSPSRESPLRRPSRPRISFVVMVRTGENSVAVHGPYRSFKRAEGDARAWDGSVEPLEKPGC